MKNQHVNQQDIVILCVDAVMCFIDILFSFLVPQKQNQNLQPRVYILKNYPWHPGSTCYSKKIKAPGSDEHGLFAGGPDSEEAGLAHDPTGMN